MAILKSVPGIEVSICVDNEPLIEHTDRNAKAEQSTVLKYVEVVPDKEFTIRITTDKSFKWTSPYIVLDIMVDGMEIRTLPIGRQEFDEELRDEIEDDLSRFKKTGEVKVGLYRAKSVRKLSATQARKHCPNFWKQPELNDHLIKDVHWDAISGRLESQSHIATLGPAKPAVEDPCIRAVYDVKYMDFDRSRSVKPQGVFKLRYRSKESLKALLVIRWDDAAIKREPMIKIESDDEDMVEDVAESVIKRERDEDLIESSMPANKRARSRRSKK
ncbi:uncharacterized protein Bfra_012272 [Botrytis fragariae]|uniref:DUF7918 domain-containing protein n=1 Tax=Botrytis fragariae TaxID=1964551 RepID=A0A8H6AJQ6_9HELO|nr:uncharacterized protein Bfra_012272 [Botrytis fragariae]KAF5868624.1 hypothetical protein Bfra_012272 [Botrytis fragariae]